MQRHCTIILSRPIRQIVRRLKTSTDLYDYYDDQAWAAGWLYLATKDSTYSSFLDKFMNDTNAGKSGQSGCKWGVYSTMCWNNVSLGAAILQSEITGDAMDWAKVTTYLNGKCTSESTYYCESDWGSAVITLHCRWQHWLPRNIPQRAAWIIPAGARHRWA